MNRIVTFGILFFMTSCYPPPFIKGKVEGNVYENSYFKFKIPNNWKISQSGGYNIFTIQKQIYKNGETGYPCVILDAGTINNNSFLTYFNDVYGLVEGSLESFSKNKNYSTINRIDSTQVNNITLYSFETKIDNKEYKIPDLLQTHYYFKIDTVYFHLSVSDYDRFEDIKADYKFLIESIEKK